MGRATTRATSSNLTTTISGSAAAIGDDTLATGTISVTTKNVGRVTMTSGEATFTATAQSSDGSIAYAEADTYADVAGADLIITRESGSTKTSQSDSQTTTTSISSSCIFALDIEAVDLPVRRVTVNHQADGELNDAGTIDGNLAVVDADLQAYGVDTYVALEASLLTMDEFSSVTASAITIA